MDQKKTSNWSASEVRFVPEAGTSILSRFSHFTLIGVSYDNGFSLALDWPDRLCATGISRLLELKTATIPNSVRLLTFVPVRDAYATEPAIDIERPNIEMRDAVARKTGQVLERPCIDDFGGAIAAVKADAAAFGGR
jgi:hypothetical protein